MVGIVCNWINCTYPPRSFMILQIPLNFYKYYTPPHFPWTFEFRLQDSNFWFHYGMIVYHFGSVNNKIGSQNIEVGTRKANTYSMGPPNAPTRHPFLVPCFSSSELVSVESGVKCNICKNMDVSAISWNLKRISAIYPI